ncbi:MAG: hypothetical protein LQ346_005138, partial [Caloplaca aetnensis]
MPERRPSPEHLPYERDPENKSPSPYETPPGGIFNLKSYDTIRLHQKMKRKRAKLDRMHEGLLQKAKELAMRETRLREREAMMECQTGHEGGQTKNAAADQSSSLKREAPIDQQNPGTTAERQPASLGRRSSRTGLCLLPRESQALVEGMVWLLFINWPWHDQYSIFQELGCDSFFTVSPKNNHLYTSDAAVIDQITRRRNDFPKPIEVYAGLDIYGKNVVSSEGNLWKHHRKTVSPPFNEKNNKLVWLESIWQAQAMVDGWIGGRTKPSTTVDTVAKDCMRLSLHVISCAGFGVKLDWPDQARVESMNGSTSSTAEKASKASQFGPDHTMTYTEALQTLLHNMIWILVLPMFLISPRTAYTSYVEWGKYLHELFTSKKADIASGAAQGGNSNEGMDLMGFLLKSSASSPSPKKSTSANTPSLTDTEITGNAFIFLLAGHETTANSIHFSMLYLALRPSSQRLLQASLDQIFATRAPSAWDYERDFPSLFSTFTGAVLAEQLRLIPPVPAIPKCVPAGSPPQPLIIAEKKYMVPPGTYIDLISTATHRNPHTWPAGKPTDPSHPSHPGSNRDNDLEEFKPERWLRSPSSSSSQSAADEQQPQHTEDSPHTSTGTSSSSALHRPPRGAYIPFSEGYRACLGRRFAQAEILAVLAVIFKSYSVELCTDAYASESEVEAMPEAERRQVWGKAKRDVEERLRKDMGMMFTMQLRGKEGVK